MATMDLTNGSAADAIKMLLQTSYDRSTDLYGQSTGLSPEALSALRTQGTSGINADYQSAAQALNSQLLRRGAVGQGALPSSPGDIARTYQPLYTAMAQQKSKAQTETILANEAQKNTSLYQNNQLAQNALTSAGGFANNLADLEPASTKNLLLTALLSGAANSGGGLISSLYSGTGTNGTGNRGILGDLVGYIPGVGPSSAGGSGTAPYVREAIKTGTPIASAAVIHSVTGTGASGISGALGSVGHAATALLTNPITAVVGAAIIGAIAWTKSQAHWEANTWVNGYQKPFDDKMAQVQQKADQLKASGQMTPATAAQIQAGAQEALSKYQQDLDKFYREKGLSSDQSRVASQAYQTFIQNYGEGGQRYLSNLVA
jgi:hypothetical protein